MPNCVRQLMCLVFCAFFTFHSTFVSAESNSDIATNREIVRTFVSYHLSQSDFISARDALTNHLTTDPDDFEAWNLLGLVYLKEGNPHKAEPALKKALERTASSQRGPVLYNYADALTRLGRWDEAKKYLKESSEFAETNDSALEAIKEGSPGKSLTPLTLTRPAEYKLSVALTSGYDTNVLLISDAALATASPTKVSAPFASIQTSTTYQKGDPALGHRRAIDCGIGFVDYFSSEASRYNMLSGYAAGSLGLGRLGTATNAVENQFDLTYLNSNSKLSFYNWSDTLQWKYRLPLRSNKHAIEFAFPMFYRKFTALATELPAYVRSGPGGGFVLLQTGDLKSIAWNVGVSYEYAHTSGPMFRAHTFSTPASATFRFSDKSWITVSPMLARILFFRASRQDMTWGGSLRYNYAITKALLTAIDYTGTKNLSSVAQAEYTKHVASLVVNYEIF